MDVNDLAAKTNPFGGYSWVTYVWVIGLSCAGGCVRYLNKSPTAFSIFILIRDVVTAGFMGLITFWLCQWTNISGPLSAVLIATSGLMGNHATRELEALWRIKFGIQYEPTINGKSVDPKNEE